MSRQHPRKPQSTPASVDDLKQITGIGPAMERRLNAAGITSYAQLAAQSAPELAGRVAGLSVAMLEKAGWIRQARRLTNADSARQHYATFTVEFLLNDDDSSEARRAKNALDDLAEVTGGVTFFPDSLEDIHTVALDLARQMRSQYLIAYRPLNDALDGSYRTIRVTAKGDGKLTVHTRAGYRAQGPGAVPK